MMVTKHRGFDNQRVPDQGDGTFLNPIFAGDHPDPTILRDGDDYFLTFSTFEVYPGLIIWHSQDLINWKPIGPALHRPLGSVFAVDLVKVESRFYIYIPVAPTAEGEYVGNLVDTFVIWTDDIFSGKWSEPIQLHIPGPIDPGHAIGEDGRR
jgi:xylan 1,4-beta-xylosidase